MSQITSRDSFDAIDPQALGLIVDAWNRAPFHGVDLDEADITLEAALLEQGVIAPHEVCSAFIRVTGGVVVHLDDGSIFGVDTNGKVFIQAQPE